MGKQYNLEKAPPEVLEVWAYQYTKIPIGSELYKRFEKTIEDNPKFFPWEHKYKSIPKEVHEAYKKECFPDFNDSINWDEAKKDNRDFADYMTSKLLIEVTKIDFEKAWREHYEFLKKQQIEQRAEQRKRKEIWDKHYSPYGLEFRG